MQCEGSSGGEAAEGLPGEVAGSPRGKRSAVCTNSEAADSPRKTWRRASWAVAGMYARGPPGATHAVGPTHSWLFVPLLHAADCLLMRGGYGLPTCILVPPGAVPCLHSSLLTQCRRCLSFMRCTCCRSSLPMKAGQCRCLRPSCFFAYNCCQPPACTYACSPAMGLGPACPAGRPPGRSDLRLGLPEVDGGRRAWSRRQDRNALSLAG